MDPIGLAGGLNLYGYAGGDPINRGDPFGLCKVQVGYTRAYGVARHAFLTVTSPDATATVFRGGPSVSASASAAKSGTPPKEDTSEKPAQGGEPGPSAANGSSYGRIDVSENEAWGPADYENQTAVGYDDPIVDDDKSCEAILASLRGTMGRIDNARIGYSPLEANSNSVVYTLLRRAGLATKALRRNAIAGDVLLVP